MISQILREWPPGYGGVERVAHQLASIWGGAVYSFDVQSHSLVVEDPLPVTYSRYRISSIRILGRFHLPLPCSSSLSILFSDGPLHGHLPSPGVLIFLLIARLFRTSRQISVHWHCFLESSEFFSRCFFRLYEWFALSSLFFFYFVVTTSPPLADELLRNGLLGPN